MTPKAVSSSSRMHNTVTPYTDPGKPVVDASTEDSPLPTPKRVWKVPTLSEAVETEAPIIDEYASISSLDAWTCFRGHGSKSHHGLTFLDSKRLLLYRVCHHTTAGGHLGTNDGAEIDENIEDDDDESDDFAAFRPDEEGIEKGMQEDLPDGVASELIREEARERARERLRSDHDSDASYGVSELDSGGDGAFDEVDAL